MKFSRTTTLIGSGLGIVVRKIFGIIRYISVSPFKELQTWPITIHAFYSGWLLV